MPLDHEYDPDPRTAHCLSCVTPTHGRGRCRWCGHNRYEHTGSVDPAVKLHLSRVVTGHNGVPVRISTVVWSTSACGMYHCACKKYE